MNIVDFKYYSETYMGHVIPAMDFSRMMQQAEQVFTQIVRGAKPEELDREKVSTVLCELGERLYVHDGQSGVKRESLDGYNVTYDTSRFGGELVNIIRRSFGDEGVLYRGRR